MTSRELEDFIEQESMLTLIRERIMDDPTLSNKSKWILIAMVENGYDCAMERQKTAAPTLSPVVDAAHADGLKAHRPQFPQDERPPERQFIAPLTPQIQSEVVKDAADDNSNHTKPIK